MSYNLKTPYGIYSGEWVNSHTILNIPANPPFEITNIDTYWSMKFNTINGTLSLVTTLTVLHI